MAWEPESTRTRPLLRPRGRALPLTSLHRTTQVSVGALNDTGIPVLSGLEPGEWVVTAGVSYLSEGQKVKLMEGKGY